MAGKLVELSVVVCTRKRFQPLLKCLESITNATIPVSLVVETLVIWNDDTNPDYKQLESIISQHDFPVRLLTQPQQGLGIARNTALSRVESDYVFFIDDDVLVNMDVFEKLANRIAQDSPDILGTRVLLHDPQDFPVTIRCETETEILTTDRNPYGFIHGCSLLLSRKAIEQVGQFDELLGAGSLLRSGEDLDYVLRGFYSGFQVVFAPDVLVYHNHGRRQGPALQKLIAGYSIGAGGLSAKHLGHGKTGPLKWKFFMIGQDLKHAVKSCSLSSIYSLVLKAGVLTLYGMIAYIILRIVSPLIRKCHQA